MCQDSIGCMFSLLFCHGKTNTNNCVGIESCDVCLQTGLEYKITVYREKGKREAASAIVRVFLSYLHNIYSTKHKNTNNTF